MFTRRKWIGFSMLLLAATASATEKKREFILIKGEIERIRIAPRQPSIYVRHGNQTTQVVLGSMRYLMEKNFAPKAGDKVEVTGFWKNEEFIASRVLLVKDGRTLQLRNEDGRPVWQGCPHC